MILSMGRSRTVYLVFSLILLFPVSLVWFYFQDATKRPRVSYHEYNVSSFKVTTFSLAMIAFSLIAIQLSDTDF